jgi:hypothetical protein
MALILDCVDRPSPSLSSSSASRHHSSRFDILHDIGQVDYDAGLFLWRGNPGSPTSAGQWIFGTVVKLPDRGAAVSLLADL